MIKIAINGFGRIGRLLFRELFDKENVQIVAINDLGNIENLAYLLKFDSVYRTYHHTVSASNKELIVNNSKILFFSERDPLKLPWADLDIDLVIEATGVFESYEKANAHIVSGAKRVILTSPAKDEDGLLGQTILLGINASKAKKVKIISNGSCTTNAVSPLMAILSENPGIEKAFLNTTHAYTATQSLVDSSVSGSDFRRGRAGACNIIPSSTGAALSVTRALPNLKDNFDGISIRVPSITGSLADVTFVSKRNVSKEEINDILLQASLSDRWRGLVEVSNDPLVSSDIIGKKVPAIIDASFTKVVGGNLVKVLSWYDNEMGYVSTLVRQIDEAINWL